MFGRLTVLSRVKINPDDPPQKSPRVLVQCDCLSPPYSVDFSNLRRGRTTRCSTCKRQASDHRTGIIPAITEEQRLTVRKYADEQRIFTPALLSEKFDLPESTVKHATKCGGDHPRALYGWRANISQRNSTRKNAAFLRELKQFARESVLFLNENN